MKTTQTVWVTVIMRRNRYWLREAKAALDTYRQRLGLPTVQWSCLA